MNGKTEKTNTNINQMQWQGESGHYEVWYLTFTDRTTQTGFWIRYTMVAPLAGQATASLWFAAMEKGGGTKVALKQNYPIADLGTTADPFTVQIGNALISDYSARGGFEQEGHSCSWDLNWQPRHAGESHVHPLLKKAKIAKTVVVLPHPDVAISGSVTLDGRTYELTGVQGGQAHLWGKKHANRWAWAHCNDFDGEVGNTYFDGVSVFVPRFGREIGPNTPILLRFRGESVNSTSPLRVIRNRSDFSLEQWEFEALSGRHRAAGRVTANRSEMVGVTYHDPDGQLAYCYNTEVADMELELFEKKGRGKWEPLDGVSSSAAAHFEYATREPVAGIELSVG